jgi:adenine phosphoribosyltransferase
MLTDEMDIAGLKRELPICRVSDSVYIGAFVMFACGAYRPCAEALLKIAPENDYLLLRSQRVSLFSMRCASDGENKYFLARKAPSST